MKPMSRHALFALTILYIWVGAFVFFEIQYNASPAHVAHYMTAQLTGVSAGVSENPFNTLARELILKERALAQKETALKEQENSLSARENELESNTLSYLLMLGALLLGLILFNFYLDWRHRKSEDMPGFSFRLR